MNEENILAAFSQLSGLGGEAARPWRSLCAAAGAYVRSLLKEGADTPENSERIHTAAAYVAYARYCSITDAQSTGSVSVGDISVSPRAGHGGTAEKMESFALGMFADILRPQGFVFIQTGVDGDADNAQPDIGG